PGSSRASTCVSGWSFRCCWSQLFSSSRSAADPTDASTSASSVAVKLARWSGRALIAVFSSSRKRSSAPSCGGLFRRFRRCFRIAVACSFFHCRLLRRLLCCRLCRGLLRGGFLRGGFLRRGLLRRGLLRLGACGQLRLGNLVARP